MKNSPTRQAAYRRERQRRGLCHNCPNPAKPGCTRCERCSEIHTVNEYNRHHREAGHDVLTNLTSDELDALFVRLRLLMAMADARTTSVSVAYGKGEAMEVRMVLNGGVRRKRGTQ